MSEITVTGGAAFAVDKAGWPPGPWSTEPDLLRWVDEATGITCEIRRMSHLGHLCGYILIPPGHPLHGVEYDAEMPEPLKRHIDRVMAMPIGKRGAIDLFCMAAGADMRPGYLFDVHGGITYGQEYDGQWWYGFDCSHSGDTAPGRSAWFADDGIYRDIEYVKAECASLARQMKELGQ
jgi:hypothetical protein